MIVHPFPCSGQCIQQPYVLQGLQLTPRQLALGLGGGGQAPLTSPCPPSNHIITINLSLTFAVTWFGHASHVDWAEHHPPNFIHGCFCHIIALHFGPQYSR